MTVPMPGPPPRPTDPRPNRPGAADPPAGASPDGARAAVARAMGGLDGLADRPLAEHVDAYERVHAALGDALAAGSA